MAPLGSGKSSILNLTKERLRQASPVPQLTEIARVSVWPFDRPEAAIGGILGAVTEVLARHVNTLPLRGLEQEYIEAIEGLSGSLGKLTRFARPGSPSATLRRYDHVAVALGVRVVLWVEDFERFAGLHKGVGEPEYLRLSPLRALLNELSALQAFQVVLASSAADFRFDLEKFARHVIAVPPLGAREAGALIHQYRQACITAFPAADAAKESERQRLWPDEKNLGWMAAWVPLSLQRALGTLCENPRMLKQALRSFGESWRVLHGEIDVDDLLMISVLGVALPEVVDLANRHINILKAGGRERFSGDKKVPPRFAAEVAEVLSRVDEGQAAAARYILNETFPGWDSGSGSSEPKRPQCFVAQHTDYWLRYWAHQRPGAAESDQAMLRLVDEWVGRVSNRLPEVMVSGVHPESLEALLAVRVTPEDLIRLLDEVVEAEAATGRHNWGEALQKGDPPVLVSVWRTMLKASPNPDAVEPVIRSMVLRVAPGNFALAFEIVYFFVSLSNQVPTVLPRERIVELGVELRQKIAEIFQGHPGMLVQSLRGAHMYILHWALWSLDSVRARQTEGAPAGWDLLRSTILESLAMAPEVMLPQVLPFIVKTQDGIQWDPSGPGAKNIRNYQFDAGAAERLFGVETFRDLLRRLPPVSLEVPDARLMLECARAALNPSPPQAQPGGTAS